MKSGLGAAEDFPLCARLRRRDLFSTDSSFHRHWLRDSCPSQDRNQERRQNRFKRRFTEQQSGGKGEREGAWCIKGDTEEERLPGAKGSGLRKAGLLTQAQDGFRRFSRFPPGTDPRLRRCRAELFAFQEPFALTARSQAAPGYSGALCFRGPVSTNACAEQSALESARRETKLM